MQRDLRATHAAAPSAPAASDAVGVPACSARPVTAAHTRRPFTVAHFLAATLAGTMAVPLVHVWCRGALAYAGWAALTGVIAGSLAALLLVHRRRLQMFLSWLGSLSYAALLLTGAASAPARATEPAAFCVGAATMMLMAACPAARYRRAGGVCVAAAALLGAVPTLPHGPPQWGLCSVAALLLVVHARISPDDWRVSLQT